MKSIVRFVTSQDPLFAQCFEMVCATFWEKQQREITHIPDRYLVYEHQGVIVSCVGVSNGENGRLSKNGRQARLQDPQASPQ